MVSVLGLGALEFRVVEKRRLGIAIDHLGWWMKFEEYARGLGIDHAVFEIERSDWLDEIDACDYVLWRPNLDPPFCEQAKEKIFFIERYMGKRVVPNWSTFWHYDNKRAQYYFFREHSIRVPWTFVSFSEEESTRILSEVSFPLVSKSCGGAASSGVRLLRTEKEARKEIRQVFHVSACSRALGRAGIDVRWSMRVRNRYVLWQEFVPRNDRDLRVTVIGKNHVFAFWRNNRKGDFRASGSGSIDYSAMNVESECRYCVDICRQHDFDSMAFDIVYKGGDSVILEMSYAFDDVAIYNCPGHFLVDEHGGMTRQEGHIWPQQLNIEYVQQLMMDNSNTSSGG